MFIPFLAAAAVATAFAQLGAMAFQIAVLNAQARRLKRLVGHEHVCGPCLLA